MGPLAESNHGPPTPSPTCKPTAPTRAQSSHRSPASTAATTSPPETRAYSKTESPSSDQSQWPSTPAFPLSTTTSQASTTPLLAAQQNSTTPSPPPDSASCPLPTLLFQPLVPSRILNAKFWRRTVNSLILVFQRLMVSLPRLKENRLGKSLKIFQVLIATRRVRGLVKSSTW